MTELNPELIERAAIAIYEEMQRPNWRAPLWDEIGASGQERFLNAARAVLEAVADDLRAEGWDEGVDEYANWVPSGPSGIPSDPPRNPYDTKLREAGR